MTIFREELLSSRLTGAGLDEVPIATAMERVLCDARIVIVDDLAANVDVLRRLLELSGARSVVGYTDPRRALDDLAARRPDLVLLDLHMPKIDGIAFLERLSELAGPKEFVPVIVLTADATEAARHRALAAGAKDFLTKPFDKVEVLLRVRNLLETRALYDQLQHHNAALEEELDAQLIAAEAEESERTRRLARLDAAMQPGAMSIVYQPYVDLADLRVVGAEALARFSCSPSRGPDKWFAEAASVGREAILELIAVDLAVSAMDRMPPRTTMSVNVSAETILGDGLHALLDSIPGERLVVELTEHSKIADYDSLEASLKRLTERGIRIAVDDAGAGYAGLQHILRLKPDVIKLDRALVTGIDTDAARQALAAALVYFATVSGAKVVAEGIETQSELTTLRDLGVDLGQGYYLARPAPLPLSLNLPAAVVERAGT